MAIGQWFSFQGRIRRRTWWLGYVLPLILISILATTLDVLAGFVEVMPQDAAPADGFAIETSGLGPFGIAGLLLSIVGGLAGQVKRWHDRDKSGWWVLITFIPIVGPLWVLVEVGFLGGTAGPNRFGPDPRGGAAPQWQPGMQQGGWQPQGWQQAPGQPQWQPPAQDQGGYPPPGWQPPPQGYPPPQQGQGGPPPGYGQPPPAPPGQWNAPGRGGSVPPVRRD